MAAHRVRQSVGDVVARGSGERAPRHASACAFDVWGGTNLGDVDIAAVFAAASVRMGDYVWLGSLPDSGGRLRRVRVSRVPVYSPGDDVDAVFLLEKRRLQSLDLKHGVQVGAALFADDAGLWPRFSSDLRAGAPMSGEASRTGAVDTPAVAAPARPAIYGLPLTALAARIPAVVHGERLVLLGMWTWMFGRNPDIVRQVLEASLARRGGRAVSSALRLFELGWHEAPQRLSARWVLVTTPADAERPSRRAAAASPTSKFTVMNGACALAAGARAAGLGICRLRSEHPLVDGIGRSFAGLGGTVVAADGRSPTAAAVRAALIDGEHGGASTALLVVAVGEDASDCLIDEHPHVVFRLERVADTRTYRAANDASARRAHPSARQRPPVVLAPTTVAECFQLAALAGAIAEQYRRHVVVLVDAALLDTLQGVATGHAAIMEAAASLFGSEGVVWPPAAAPDVSVADLLRQLQMGEAPLETFVRPAKAVGGNAGDVLIVGWGATRGPVEEAVAYLRAHGRHVSALHLRTLQPLPARLGEVMGRFRRVVLADVASEPHRRAQHIGTWLACVADARPLEAVSPRISLRAFTSSASISPADVCQLALTALRGYE